MLHIAEEEIVLDDDKEIAPVREEGVQDPQAEEDIDEESRTKFASVVVLEAHQKCQMWQRKNCNTESSVRCGVLVWRGVAWRGVVRGKVLCFANCKRLPLTSPPQWLFCLVPCLPL